MDADTQEWSGITEDKARDLPALRADAAAVLDPTKLTPGRSQLDPVAPFTMVDALTRSLGRPSERWLLA
jgi:hypothetical protein